MKYEDLNIHQKIGLKGFFISDPKMKQYRLIWVVFNFKKAINYFLTGNVEELTP